MALPDEIAYKDHDTFDLPKKSNYSNIDIKTTKVGLRIVSVSYHGPGLLLELLQNAITLNKGSRSDREVSIPSSLLVSADAIDKRENTLPLSQLVSSAGTP